MTLDLLNQLDKIEMLCDLAIPDVKQYQELREEIDRLRNGIISLAISRQEVDYASNS